MTLDKRIEALENNARRALVRRAVAALTDDELVAMVVVSAKQRPSVEETDLRVLRETIRWADPGADVQNYIREMRRLERYEPSEEERELGEETLAKVDRWIEHPSEIPPPLTDEERTMATIGEREEPEEKLPPWEQDVKMDEVPRPRGATTREAVEKDRRHQEAWEDLLSW